MSIWKNENDLRNVSEVYKMVDCFFEGLRSSKTLEYREGQHTMALDIAEVIQNKEVLLIEAGVGIGKSYAYLIPILYAMEHDSTFHGFIISTSTIALQEQLKNDIQTISKILGIHIPVTVAKGKANYVCLRRLEEFVESHSKKNKRVQQILKRIENGAKDRLDFADLSQDFWDKIHITTCTFSDCYKALKCPYFLSRKKFTQDSAIICNHDLLIENLKRDTDDKILCQTDLLVIDEAHTLEDKIRDSYLQELEQHHIEVLIYNICYQILRITNFQDIEQEYWNGLNSFYKEMLIQAKMSIKKNMRNHIDSDECVRFGFKVAGKTSKIVEHLICQIEALLKRVSKYEISSWSPIQTKDVFELKEILHVLKDIYKAKNSDNIYWIEFIGDSREKVKICYVPRKIHQLAGCLLSDDGYGKVLTSATLTTRKDDYSYYANSIGLDRLVGTRVVKEFSQRSPYNYQENTLLYCATDIANPKKKGIYLTDIAERIGELLMMTEGRGLVLFTAKADMKKVYEALKKMSYEFPLYMQEEGKGSYFIEKFRNEEHASLFGTGMFWEGIDVRGSSLSNLIIAKLPFPVVEPVVQAKASVYNDGFREVYLPEMVLKLKQGIGRLIRGENETGIISILDSRMASYDLQYHQIITNSLPNIVQTSDLEEVREFAKNKILNLSK